MLKSPQFDMPPGRMADAVRILSVDAIERAKSGHPGMPLGMADAAVALFGTGMKFDPKDPLWPDRDRFVLSAGHGSMLLYAALHLTGYPGFGIDTLKNFRQWKSIAAGHPEVEQAHGIETTLARWGKESRRLSAWPWPNVSLRPSLARIWLTTTLMWSAVTAA